jgi:predicted DsbA family dithiol-disulfide isomerase
MQASPEQLEMGNLLDIAQELGLDVAAFRLCVESGKYKEDIQREAHDAASKGVHGTPAFIIGKNTSAGVEGELVVGAVALEVFDQKLNQYAK